MRLRELQLALRDILREPNSSPTTDDPELAAYLESVASSGRMEILTHIIRAWRAYDVGRVCPLTAIALRARGLWEQALSSLIADPAPSAFIDEFAEQVLTRLAAHDDPLVASVARFERAYSAARRGSTERFVVWWDREPIATLAQLLTESPTFDAVATGAYMMTVSRQLPHLFDVVSDSANGLKASH